MTTQYILSFLDISISKVISIYIYLKVDFLFKPRTFVFIIKLFYAYFFNKYLISNAELVHVNYNFSFEIKRNVSIIENYTERNN